MAETQAVSVLQHVDVLHVTTSSDTQPGKGSSPACPLRGKIDISRRHWTHKDQQANKQSLVIQVMSAVSKSYLQSLIVFAEAHPGGFLTAGQCDAR